MQELEVYVVSLDGAIVKIYPTEAAAEEHVLDGLKYNPEVSYSISCWPVTDALIDTKYRSGAAGVRGCLLRIAGAV